MSSVTVTPVVLDTLWKKDGTNYYRIRVTFGRQSKYIKTNILVRREHFSRGKLQDASVRYKVEALMRSTEEAVRTIDTYALSNMDISQVVEYIQRYGEGEFRLDFLAFGLEEAARMRGSSANTYRIAVNRFAEYLEADSFDIGGVTSSLMRGWEEWLTDKYGAGARAVSAYTRCIAALHSRARLRYNNEETGYVPIKNPFAYYKPPRQKTRPHRAVDKAFIQKMIDMRKDLDGRERLGVDVFLLSFALMGMNSPDLYSCKYPVNGVLQYNRAKTKDRREDGAEMAVKISPKIKPIVREYEGRDGYAFDFRDRYTTYEIFGSNVNAGLKKYCERVKHQTVTLYWARHSFASIAHNVAGIEKGVVNDCLCHVDPDMKVTDNYIQKDWSVLWKANEKVLSLFTWKQKPAGR